MEKNEKKKNWFVNISEYHHQIMGLLLRQIGSAKFSPDFAHFWFLDILDSEPTIVYFFLFSAEHRDILLRQIGLAKF